MPPRKTNRRRNENQPGPSPIQEYSLNEHVYHVEFRAIFSTLAHSIVAQNVRPVTVQANPVANISATRIWDFARMNIPLFLGCKSEEDPQESHDMVQKVIDIMGVTSSECAELATYQLQDVTHTWFK